MVVYSEGVEFGLGQLSIGATLPLMLADEGGCSRWVYMVCLDFETLVTILGVLVELVVPVLNISTA